MTVFLLGMLVLSLLMPIVYWTLARRDRHGETISGLEA